MASDDPSALRALDSATLAQVEQLSLRARRIVEGLRSGLHRSPFHGASVEFAEHKEYAPGDPLRFVDWKLFGKSDKYYVKRFEEETNLLAWILLDVSASMGYGRTAAAGSSWWQRLRARGTSSSPGVASDGPGGAEIRKLDHAVLLAASLSMLLLNQGDAVGLYTFGQGADVLLPPRARASHLQALLTQLVGARSAGSGLVSAALETFAPRVQRRSLIILISDLLEDPDRVLTTMKRLRTLRNDVLILQVLHEDELTFPYEDVSLFEDPEDPVQTLIADPREVKEGYHRELEAFLTNIRRRCAEAQVEHRLIRTGMSIPSALGELLASRQRGGR